MRLTETLARASSRRPWVTIGLWLVAIVAAGALSSQLLDGVLTTDADFTNDPEAKRAAEVAEDRFGAEGVTEIFLVTSESATASEPAFETKVRQLQASATEIGGAEIQDVVTYYDTKDPSMVSEDGRWTLVPVTFKETEEFETLRAEIAEIRKAGNEIDAIEVSSFGQVSLDRDFSTIAEEDLATGEMFGVGVALIVLVIVFGAIVAGLIPIAMGIASIVIATGVVALVGQAFTFSFFVVNMISMMGLAVGIDYSLFIVSRYREERHQGRDKLDAIGATSATASRAVFFSGLTVVLALVGMLIIPTTIFRSLAAGAIFVVVIAMLASLTLLPALLGILGDRVNSLRVFRRKSDLGSAESHRFWDRITHGVMRRPVASLIVGAGLLLVGAFAYLDINTGFAGVSTLPDDAPSRRAFNVLTTEFSGGMNSPIEIVVDGDVASRAVRADIVELQDLLASDRMFGPSRVEVDQAKSAAIVSAPVNGDPSSAPAVASIDRVRDEYVPQAFDGTSATVLVGGDTAFNKDFFDLTDTYTPIVFAFVLGLSFLLLTVVFRSIVVPIKAIIMNLLSVGAAYGLIVLVFQKGYGAGVLGFDTVDSIEAWLPLFLFSVLFGLSMDYHVFLLSRIRERFDITRNNAESVAYGLRTTGGLITGAAAIMVAVFAGFAAGDLVAMQQMGFGLAVAVLLDATIVRSVLVPASMRLLGDRNWYLPRWLQWLPDVHVEGTHARVPQQQQQPVLETV
ncbi:MAG: MMPL family transporter [Actinomycetota bacterium]